MTKVFYHDGKTEQRLIMSGHAGNELVCATIGGIAQTLMRNMWMEQCAGQVEADAEMETPGEILLTVHPKAESMEAIRRMFRFTINGLKMVAEEFPDNIEIEEEKESGIV